MVAECALMPTSSIWTARNAGVAVWLLPYGYNMGASVEDCRPDRVIQDFSELL